MMYVCCLTNQNEGQTYQMYFVKKMQAVGDTFTDPKIIFFKFYFLLFSPLGLVNSKRRVFSVLLPFFTKQINACLRKV